MKTVEKMVIWFIGSSASGKTTQSRMLHELFRESSESNEKPELCVRPGEFKYSWMNPYSIHIGDLINPIACAGTDTLKNKSELETTFKEAMKRNNLFIVVDGILSTGQWIDIFKTDRTEVLLIHLKVNIDNNLVRLRQRRAKKKGIPPQEVEITPETKLSLEGKIKSFQSLYDRMKEHCVDAIEIDTNKLNVDQIHNVICNFFRKQPI